MPIIRAISTALVDEEMPVIGWHNLVTTSNIEATSSDADFPATNLANPATHLVWKSGINTGDEYLTVLTNYAGEIDYLAIAGHNFGTGGNTLSVEGTIDPNSPFDSPGFTELVQATVITDDCPLIFQFDPQVIGAIRLRIQGGGDVFAQAAVMYVGKLLVMERSIDIGEGHVPINLGKVTRTVTGSSEGGQFLGRIVLNQFSESKVSFKWITPAWYRANFNDFAVASKDTPFFWAWNPDEQPDDVGYCWATKDIIPEVDPATRRMSVIIEMRGLACT